MPLIGSSIAVISEVKLDQKIQSNTAAETAASDAHKRMSYTTERWLLNVLMHDLLAADLRPVHSET